MLEKIRFIPDGRLLSSDNSVIIDFCHDDRSSLVSRLDGDVRFPNRKDDRYSTISIRTSGAVITSIAFNDEVRFYQFAEDNPKAEWPTREQLSAQAIEYSRKLQADLGDPPYQYEWGAVSVFCDEKSWTAGILVTSAAKS